MVERNSTKTTNIVRTSKGNQFAITGRRIGTKTGTTDICYYFVHCLYDLNSDFDAGIRTYQSGTSGGTRTHTLVKEADFESAASTNSATLATRNNLIKTGVI